MTNEELISILKTLPLNAEVTIIASTPYGLECYDEVVEASYSEEGYIELIAT